MIALFSNFAITMTGREAVAMSHSSDCLADVKFHAQQTRFRRQLNKIPPEQLAAELKEYGAWDKTELSNHVKNRYRILWLAACDIRESMTPAQLRKANSRPKN